MGSVPLVWISLHFKELLAWMLSTLRGQPSFGVKVLHTCKPGSITGDWIGPGWALSEMTTMSFYGSAKFYCYEIKILNFTVLMASHTCQWTAEKSFEKKKHIPRSTFMRFLGTTVWAFLQEDADNRGTYMFYQTSIESFIGWLIACSSSTGVQGEK